jgi:hypothetical protein
VKRCLGWTLNGEGSLRSRPKSILFLSTAVDGEALTDTAVPAGVPVSRIGVSCAGVWDGGRARAMDCGGHWQTFDWALWLGRGRRQR